MHFKSQEPVQRNRATHLNAWQSPVRVAKIDCQEFCRALDPRELVCGNINILYVSLVRYGQFPTNLSCIVDRPSNVLCGQNLYFPG